MKARKKRSDIYRDVDRLIEKRGYEKRHQRCQPIHILRSWPHMHRIGAHMKIVITRAGGATETLVDEPFNFNTQIAYDTPTVINPGDKLTTTCTYKNDGAGTVREPLHELKWPAKPA